MPAPENPCLIPDAQDPGPEMIYLTWVGVSALAQPRLVKGGQPYLMHLGAHALLPYLDATGTSFITAKRLLQHLDVVDAVELAVVRELADELLLGVDLEDLGGGAEMAVAEPVHDDRVAVREAFDGAG